MRTSLIEFAALVLASCPALGQPLDLKKISPSEYRQKAMERINSASSGFGSKGGFLANSQPVTIATTLAKEDLAIPGVEVEVTPPEIWWRQLCDSIQASSPLARGAGHFYMGAVSVSPVFQASFEEQVKKLALCIGSALVQPVFFPIAAKDIVILMKAQDTLPSWVTADDLMAGTLYTMPREDTRSFDNPYEVTLECAPIEDANKAVQDPCMAKTVAGKEVPGHLRQVRKSLYRERNARNRATRPGTIRYRYNDGPNRITNWANIDWGIKSTPIDILVIDDEITPSIRQQTLRNDLATRLCMGHSELVETQGANWKTLSPYICRFRENRISYIATFPRLDRETDIVLSSLAKYLRGRSGTEARALYPLSASTSSNRQISQSEARRDFFALRSSTFSATGWTIWMVMDPRAAQQPNARKYLDLVSSGPLNVGYAGPLAFFSDLANAARD